MNSCRIIALGSAKDGTCFCADTGRQDHLSNLLRCVALALPVQ